MKCKQCGKTFYAAHTKKKFCSAACYDAWRKTSDDPQKRRPTGAQFDRTPLMGGTITSHFREMKRRELLEAKARKERLSARDAAYAAAFPELATGACRGKAIVGSHLCKFGNMEADMLRKS